MSKVTFYSCITSLLLLLSSCGGGGTGNAVPLPMNTAVVLSVALAAGRTSTSLPIRGIQATFDLPQTATPILDPTKTDGSLLVGETALKDLNLNPNGSIQGSYVPRTVTIILVNLSNDPTNDLGTGDIARLTCDISSGAHLSVQDIQNLVFKVSGPGSVDITNEIVPAVSIVTYQKP